MVRASAALKEGETETISRERNVRGRAIALTVFLSPWLQEQKFCQRYDQLMEAWEKKVERIENNPRRRAKESKVREYYEKQFPEIRKQRELQERMQRWDYFIPFLKK